MPVVYETNADIPSFGGINTTGDGYNMSFRLAREMENVDCSGGGFTQMRQGRMLLQQLSAPIETLEILHRRWGLRSEDGVITEQPDWLVAVAGGNIYTKTLDGDDDWTLRYEGLTESRCSCVAYEVNDFDPMEVGELGARVGDDGKSLIATKPTATKGSGVYTFNYVLQKTSGEVTGDVSGGTAITDEVTLTCPDNGLYRVKAVVSDGTTEQTRYSPSFIISAYEAYGSLHVEMSTAHIDTDDTTIVCPKPKVSGGYPGPEGYTYAYSVYDSNNALIASFYSLDDLVYVATPYNGFFTVIFTASDGKSSKTVDYGWFEITKHQRTTELNVGILEAQLMSNRKGFFIKRP